MLGRVCGWGADDGPLRIHNGTDWCTHTHTHTHLDPQIDPDWPVGKTLHEHRVRSVFCRTLMGPSTGSSPCSDSCFKALRAAWEEREQQMVEWERGGRERGRTEVGGEWVSPFSCFSNNTYSGKPDASRTLSLRSLLSLAPLLSLFVLRYWVNISTLCFGCSAFS